MYKIIEFTGVPGSGKSYISQELTKYFINSSEYDEWEIIYLNFKKINKDFYKFKNLYNFFDIFIIKIIFTYLYHEKFTKRSITSIKTILLGYYKYFLVGRLLNESHHDKHIFIIDEGILHVNNQLFSVFNYRKINSLFRRIKLHKVYKYYLTSYNYIIEMNINDAIINILNRESGWPYAWRNFNNSEKLKEMQKMENSILFNQSILIDYGVKLKKINDLESLEKLFKNISKEIFV